MSKYAKLFYLPFMGISLVVIFAFGISVFNEYRELQFARVRTKSCQGILSDTKINKEEDSDGDEYYTTDATIRFKERGKEYREVVRISGKHHDGDTHVIHYNPDDPKDNSIHSTDDLKNAMVMSFVGIFIAASTFVVMAGKLIGKF